MNSSRTQQVLRQRGTAIAAGGMAFQLLSLTGLLYGSPFGVLTLLLVLGTAGALAVSFYTQKNKTDLAIKLQAATVISGLICVFTRASPYTFVLLLIGAGVTYFGAKQLAAGLSR